MFWLWLVFLGATHIGFFFLGSLFTLWYTSETSTEARADRRWARQLERSNRRARHRHLSPMTSRHHKASDLLDWEHWER